MARMLRSAAGMQRAIHRSAPSIRGRPVEPKVDTLIETLKDTGVSSVNKEFVHQTAHSIDLAREDKVVWKVTEAGLMAVLIASGLTFGSTLVLESDRLRMSKRGRKVVEKA
ncbi:uncharacterized protein LOC120660143 [Panicum virgatum]|uniref:uncharacterized protein LOC120660143 n=1 Tax=Panicum virgatum TaxID=38727 RepID=UPI0019D54781|nr:uncharacterized protein LOC120660143 [Panicum virgatum]